MALLLGLGLAACGSDETPRTNDPVTPAPSWDPAAAGAACQLIPQREVTEALGRDPGPGTPSVDGSLITCEYPPLLSVWVHNDAAYAGDWAGGAEQLISLGEATKVDGLGEFGITSWAGDTLFVYFVKSQRVVTVQVHSAGLNSDRATVEAGAVSLAEKAAARM